MLLHYCNKKTVCCNKQVAFTINAQGKHQTDLFLRLRNWSCDAVKTLANDVLNKSEIVNTHTVAYLQSNTMLLPPNRVFYMLNKKGKLLYLRVYFAK